MKLVEGFISCDVCSYGDDGIGLNGNLDQIVLENTKYRHILYTTEHQQLVAMSIKPDAEIPWEKHERATQFIYVVKGDGTIEMSANGRPNYKTLMNENEFSVVYPGTKHRVSNRSATEDLKLVTLYSPPIHKNDVD
jgi:mannose-6-phosphate isomerase-like protein (cupin superfamily)